MTVRNVMELVLWSLSNSLRGFNVVIVEITSHSVSAEYQCHTCPRLWLQHFYMDSFGNFFCCCLREKCELDKQYGAVSERTWKGRQCPEMYLKIPKVSLFVSFIMEQVFPLFCWYANWEMSSLLPHLHSYGTKAWKSSKSFLYIFPNLT